MIDNILIVFGSSALFGGLRRGIQVFDARAATARADLMSLAVVSLVIPAVFGAAGSADPLSPPAVDRFSIGVALALASRWRRR